MSNSLSDQLLKAGLITQDQISKADEDKQKQKEKARAKFKNKAGKQPPRPKNNPQKPASKPKKPSSDLAKFYQQRNQVEQAERTAEEKQKRETAERRRKTRKQIRKLVEEHSKNAEDASIRYNFVVGETVKYLFVTEDQQRLIASGELSITFMDGKRCLIPMEIGEQIRALDPEKVVVHVNPDEADPIDDFPAVEAEVNTETPATETDEKPVVTTDASTGDQQQAATPSTSDQTEPAS